MAGKPGAGVIRMEGQTFGRLTVLSLSAIVDQAQWLCLCTCGNRVVVRGRDLRRGHTLSCGCLKVEKSPTLHVKHGAARGKGQRKPEYGVWVGIIARCENQKATSYPRYGARGISICRRWRESFAAFLADVGPRPSEAHSIDRIDNGGNYEPGNCRWATASEQNRNRRPRRRRASVDDSELQVKAS